MNIAKWVNTVTIPLLLIEIAALIGICVLAALSISSFWLYLGLTLLASLLFAISVMITLAVWVIEGRKE